MTRLSASVMLAMAVACFTAVLAALGASGLTRVSERAEAQRNSYFIVRVLAPEGPAAVTAAVQALRGDPRVAAARAMTPDRASAMLRLWLGREVAVEDLPPLRLVEVTLRPNAPPAQVSAGPIAAALAGRGLAAQASSAPVSAEAARARRLRSAAAAGAAALGVVMAAIVALSARAYAARRRDYITVMADLGAARWRALLAMSDEAGARGFAAGLAGAAGAALFAIGFLALAVSPENLAPILRRGVAAADVAILAATPFFAAMAAALGAAWSASGIYDAAARLR